VNTFYSMLEEQKGKKLGQPVDLYNHGVQTASRAYRAGEPIDIVVMSLFHDMTESLVAKNHGEVAAGFLEPYLSPRATWMLRQHEVFQGYYYFHHFGGNRNEREAVRETPDGQRRDYAVYDPTSRVNAESLSPDGGTDALDESLRPTWYEELVAWCEKYDQKSFDAYYPMLPTKFFRPMVVQVLSREPFWWDPKHPKRVAVTGAGVAPRPK
jgi:predicted HD phosphohydrolase